MLDWETVETESVPMLYVSRRSGKEPTEINAVMEEAFGKLVYFINEKGIKPAGPPIAIYRDWDSAKMTIEAGFPVHRTQLDAAGGGILAGQTPGQRALKIVHRGPYTTLHETHAQLEERLRRQGIKHPNVAWEIYLSDPDTTPEHELVTEIYMPLTVN